MRVSVYKSVLESSWVVIRGRLKEQTGEEIQGDGVGAGTLEVLGGVVAPRYRKSIVRALA